VYLNFFQSADAWGGGEVHLRNLQKNKISVSQNEIMLIFCLQNAIMLIFVTRNKTKRKSKFFVLRNSRIPMKQLSLSSSFVFHGVFILGKLKPYWGCIGTTMLSVPS
jgi:hypothetical protein